MLRKRCSLSRSGGFGDFPLAPPRLRVPRSAAAPRSRSAGPSGDDQQRRADQRRPEQADQRKQPGAQVEAGAEVFSSGESPELPSAVREGNRLGEGHERRFGGAARRPGQAVTAAVVQAEPQVGSPRRPPVQLGIELEGDESNASKSGATVVRSQGLTL
jgi:hypothetical protein